MSTKTVIVDDLTEEQGAKRHTFMLDGLEYEIDLVDPSFARFSAALNRFIDHARLVTTKPTKATARVSPLSADKREAIRAWGRAHGFTVGDRGRLASTLMAAYLDDPWNQTTTSPRLRVNRAPSPRPNPVRVRTNRPQEIRDWAAKNGYEVKDRGRISVEILRAHTIAMNSTSTRRR